MEKLNKDYDEMSGIEFFNEFKTLDDYIEYFTWNTPSDTDEEYKQVLNAFKLHQMLIDPYGRWEGDTYVPQNKDLDDEQLETVKIKNPKLWAKNLYKNNLEVKKDNVGFQMMLQQLGIKNTRKSRNAAKEIEIDGVTYISVTDAANKLGITRQALYKRLKKTNTEL